MNWMDNDLVDPRSASRNFVRMSIEPALWQRNEQFSRKLEELIVGHRLYRHPIIEMWERNEFSLQSLRYVHLEVRSAFLEVFMESLLRLMQTTSQLERRLGPKAKIAARFLIQLNVLDELGFVPGGGEGHGFLGHPAKAHYWQLMDTLVALGAPPSTWWDEPMSPEAQETRGLIEAQHDDHLRLASLLATIETVFIPFYGPWAANTVRVCPIVNTASDYHRVHIEDEEGHSVDDDHSEDSWYIVRQALTEDRYEEIERLVGEALDVWAALMDSFVNRHHSLKHAA
jgi:hypothetical protein